MADTAKGWKQRAEHAEHRLTELEEHGGGGEPSGRVKQLEDQLAALQRELASVQDEREALATQSKAPRASDDDLAIRRLYEDLTGFTVTEVERAEPGSDFRRFHLLFSGANYHGTSRYSSRIAMHARRDAAAHWLASSTVHLHGRGAQRPHLYSLLGRRTRRGAAGLDTRPGPLFAADQVRSCCHYEFPRHTASSTPEVAI